MIFDARSRPAASRTTSNAQPTSASVFWTERRFPAP
jgi:hypothetical protein